VVNPRLQSEKILVDLQYDFRDFTIEHFIKWIGELKGRRILSFPLKMPAGLFGAWLTDDEEPNEYIFYRADVPPMYQIHIQLHELAHLLLGHPTLHITRELLAAALSGQGELPFNELARLRSTVKPEDSRSIREVESEILASVIQEQIIRYSQLKQLTRGISSDRNIANYLKDLGMI
jgi:hypothetical protein